MAEVLESSYELVALERLQPHPRNPRRGDVEAIAKSVEHNGFYGAVVAQRSTGYVLAGNHRLEGAKAAGHAEVPCIWVDVDDDQALRILLVDNRTSDQSVYDEETLIAQLKELKATDAGLVGSGFDDRYLNRLLSGGAKKAADGSLQIWRLIIDCETEEQQNALVEELSKEGYRVKPRVVD